MRRVLLVLRGPISAETLARRYQAFSTDDGELAVRYELPSGADGFREALSAQKALTEALRLAWGARAERVAICAVSEREGDRVEDCALAWGASEVCAQD